MRAHLALLLLFASLGAGLLPVFGCATAPPPPSAQSPLAAQPVPDFKRRALDGREVDTKVLRGHGLVVKFMARYCEPCKRTLPAVQSLAAAHPEIAFVGVAEDEHASEAQALVADYGLTFPVVHDAGNALAGRYRVSEMPVTFVVDAAGTVRWVGGPAHSEHDLVAAINAFAR